MSWTLPRDWTNEEKIGATIMNAHVRDDLRYLKGLDGTTVFDDAITAGGILTLGGAVTGGNYSVNSVGHIGLGNQAADADYGLYYWETILIDDNNPRTGTHIDIEAYKTSANFTSYLGAGYFTATIDNQNTYPWTNTVGLRGVESFVVAETGTAAEKAVTGIAAFYAGASVGGAANDIKVTNYYGLYITAEALVGNSKLTNDYGIYVANQAGGATLNYAIYTAGGDVYHAGNLQIAGTSQFDSLVTGIVASEIEVEELSTATYDDVQDYINFFGDRTLLSGGAISDNGNGTVAIASLTGWCSISDSETAVGKFFNYAGGNTPSLTDLTTNYIYLDYNGGTPQLVVSTSILTHGFKLDHIHVGTAFRDGTETHFHKPTNFELDLGAKVNIHHQEETFVHRVVGLVTTQTGTRNLSITAGASYEGLNRHTSLPFDTSRSGTADFNEVNKLHDAGGDFSVNDVGKSVHNTTDDTYGTITARIDSTELTLAGDTFPLGTEAYNIDFWTYHYYDGNLGTPAWVEVHGATQISNSQYNDVDTGLANFTANRYGVSWVFMEIDGLHIHVVYGQGDYKVNEAEEAGVPSFLPNIVTNYCALIAKIILRQGQTIMTITYPWTTIFTSSLATDHGSLGGLEHDDHTQYFLLAGETTDSKLYSGADLIVYSDAGSTEVARIDGATGAITTSSTVDGVDVSAHAVANTGVHGIGASTFATASTLATHAALITGVHGLVITADKTFTLTNSLTLSGTDASTLNIGTGGTLGTAAYTATTAYEASGAVSTHAAIKAANATLGHVIVETSSLIDVDGDGKLTLGAHAHTSAGTGGDYAWADFVANDVTYLKALVADITQTNLVDKSAAESIAGTWTFASPTINGTIGTTGLTMPALTLGGTVTLGGQVLDAAGGDAKMVTTGSGYGLYVQSIQDTVTGGQITGDHISANPAGGNAIFTVAARARDSNNDDTSWARWEMLIENVTHTTECGKQAWHNKVNNVWNLAMTLSSAGALWTDLSVNTLTYKVSGTQVVGARVVDARCDDAINSGDATTDGVIDSLRDAMITHGLIAAA